MASTHERSDSIQTWRRFVPSRLERDDPFALGPEDDIDCEENGGDGGPTPRPSTRAVGSDLGFCLPGFYSLSPVLGNILPRADSIPVADYSWFSIPRSATLHEIELLPCRDTLVWKYLIVHPALRHRSGAPSQQRHRKSSRR